jgi:hypothetical protein
MVIALKFIAPLVTTPCKRAVGVLSIGALRPLKMADGVRLAYFRRWVELFFSIIAASAIKPYCSLEKTNGG